MQLTRLKYKNFRNIETIDFTPSEGFNIFWGDNAQGKTNLLEAIYLLGHLKSFRGARNPELIRSGSDQARLQGEVTNLAVNRRLELAIEQASKSVRIDGKKVRSGRDFFGFLRPVLFSPEEVSLVKGPPAGRRALLDRSIFQAQPLYLEKVQEYERCLKQRNRLLKEGRLGEELIPWTEGLIDAGGRLRWERFRYLVSLAPLLRQCYDTIAGNGEKADIHIESPGEKVEDFREALRSELKKAANREVHLGQTLAGPHRDDPLFLIEGRPLRLYGSQGQQRSFMLAYKTAQIIDLEKRLGEPPILLLDDMTSELDRHRKGFLFHFLLSRRGQVFLTTTDCTPFKNEGMKIARFFRVTRGNIIDEG